MAKRKKADLIEEISSPENSQEERVIPEGETLEPEVLMEEIPAPIVLPAYKFNVGDRVVLTKTGNADYSGAGLPVIKKSGLKWIGNIIQGGAYPYQIITERGKFVGYFKEDALKKI